MSGFSKFCAGGLGLLLIAQVASAATITELFGPITIPSAPNSGSFTVPQFDDLGGTRVLDQVKITLNGQANGGQNIFDSEDAVNPGTVDFINLGSKVTVTGPASLLVITNPIQVNAGPVTIDTDGAADYIGTDSLGISGGNSSDSDTDTINVGLAPYIGLSTLSFNYSKVNDFNASYDVTGSVSSIAPTTIFDGSVEYTYHEVPEPASLGLIGLAACGLVRRRRAI